MGATAPDARWDDYVRAHPNGRAYHLSAWAQILSGAYRARPRCLTAEDGDGRIRGVLPIFEESGLVRGRRLCSLPVDLPAGPLADTTRDLAGLLARACGLARERHASGFCFDTNIAGCEELADVAVNALAPYWSLELPADPDELLGRWRRSSNVARSLRKAQAAGVIARESDARDDLRRFYRLYAQTMKRHRLLARNLRQMELMRQTLGAAGVFRLLLAEHDGAPVAAGVFLVLGDTMELLYNGSDDAHWDLRPNHALHWGAMCWAIEHGLRRFDFGAAWPHLPLGRFKRQWGAEPTPTYRYVHAAGRAPAHRDGRPRRQRRLAEHRLASAIWDRTPPTVLGGLSSLATRHL